MKKILGTAMAALLFAGAAIAAQPTWARGHATAACSANGKDVTIGGKAATVFCGPARVTVHVGSRTMTFRNGTCVWTSNSFKVRLGTIFLFRSTPLQPQAGFSLYAAGYPVARALIEVYSGGTYTFASTLHTTARPSPNRAGGTFTGKTGKSGTGPKISGTVSCA